MQPVTEEYLRECFEGKRLYGDEFDENQVRGWFEQEQNAYFDLADHREAGDYLYDALNRATLFRHLAGKHFDTCLGFGCAFGDDVAPLAPQVGRFLIIEPSERCWRPSIGGKPATFMKPSLTGAIALPDASVDLVAAISSLHHVPQVSFIVSEFARVLKPGGMFVVRDPCISMGDWREPRPGLTPNQRGIPRPWFEDVLRKNGFEICAVAPCIFGPIGLIWRKIPALRPFARSWLVLLDQIACSLTAWNSRYHRMTFLQRFSAQSMAYVARKR